MDVEFEEESYEIARPRMQKKTLATTMKKIIYKLGLAKNEAQMQRTLLVIAVILLVVSAILLAPVIPSTPKVYIAPADPALDPSLAPHAR